MTNERKKAVLYLVLTLVFGILIGALIPGFFGRFHEGGGRMRDQRGGGLTHIISRVVKPDSVQATRIKPIIAQTASRIEGLQNGCNQEVKNVMDSLRLQLQPLLTTAQLNKLDEFLTKGKDRWKGR